MLQIMNNEDVKKLTFPFAIHIAHHEKRKIPTNIHYNVLWQWWTWVEYMANVGVVGEETSDDTTLVDKIGEIVSKTVLITQINDETTIERRIVVTKSNWWKKNGKRKGSFVRLWLEKRGDNVEKWVLLYYRVKLQEETLVPGWKN